MNGLVLAGVGDALDGAKDPVAVVLAMCEQALAVLQRVASVVEARDVLAACSLLEHAVKVRDLNNDAVTAASTLRIRAERRVGELLAEQRQRGERAARGRPKNITDGDVFPTLADQGLTLNESAKYQRLAAAPEPEFEKAIEKVTKKAHEQRIQVTRDAVMREIDPASDRRPSDAFKDVDAFKSACDKLDRLTGPALDALRWKQFPGGDVPYPALMAVAVLLSIQSARVALDRVEAELRRTR
jgi:hypothetical protein